MLAHFASDTHLDEELIPPSVQSLKALARVDIVNKHTAVGTTVEGDAERLETLLTSRVPQLHGNDTVVDDELASEEVGTCTMKGLQCRDHEMPHG